METKDLLYYNGFGGFSKDGKEYVLKTSERFTVLPWSHVIANERFGTIVTSSGGGYVWSGNSRENKLTAWCNNQVSDEVSEEVLIRLGDRSFGVVPRADLNEFEVRYGFGYARFLRVSGLEDVGIRTCFDVYVPRDRREKICVLEVENFSEAIADLELFYKVNPVLGTAKEFTKKHLKFADLKDGVVIQNSYRDVYKDERVFVEVLGKDNEVSMEPEISRVSGISEEMAEIGEVLSEVSIEMAEIGEVSSEVSIEMVEIGEVSSKVSIEMAEIGEVSSEVSIEMAEIGEVSSKVSKDKMVELGTSFKVLAGQKRKVIFRISVEEKREFPNVSEDLRRISDFWDDVLGRVKVRTPVESFNVMMNGWLGYQTMACRLFARTSFYQSGGAYGFRDQLQDSLMFLSSKPEFTRKQILYHARFQFKEGDVLHWWHPERCNGIRTRCSDDLLWLPFVICRYLEATR